MTESSLEKLWPYLTEPEKGIVLRWRNLNPPPLWSPYPPNPETGIQNPQELAYHNPADVLGYGGAAGGGKSDLILGLAATQHQRSVIFRREASQGSGLIDRAREIFGAMGRLNENTGTWRDLPGGRYIRFAGVKDLGDEQRWRGRAHDFVAFDEGDQFLEAQFRFLQGWNRTVLPQQRCRVVICFNPPTDADGRWLLDYFKPWLAYLFPRKFHHKNPAAPGELRWYAMVPDKDGKPVEAELPDGKPFDVRWRDGKVETIQPKSRSFIPAKVEDNPKLLARGYKATLQSLTEPLRSQVLYGDFTAGLEDDAWQVIPSAWVEAAMRRWEEAEYRSKYITAVGVDVARGGKDQTVISKRYVNWFAELEKHPGVSTPDGPLVAQLVLASLDGTTWPKNLDAVVNVDVTGGCGASPYDFARQLGLKAVPVNFGAGTHRYDKSGTLAFANIRAWLFWTMREALDPESGLDLCLPPDSELMADLTAPKWSLRTGKILIESKEDLVKRLGRSTDCADAVVLANAEMDSADGEPLILSRGRM